MKLHYENIWVRNILFLLLVTTVMYFQGRWVRQEDVTMLKALGANLVLFTFVFVHNHFLLEKLLLRHKYLQYATAVIIHLCIVNVFVCFFGSYIGKPMQVPLIGQFITIGMMHLVGTAFYFMHLSILSHIQQTEKKLEHSFSEINYLKQQLNPHFLLNAINNLYGVALSTPNDVPDKILELSDLLKYQINTIKKDWIALQVEMDFIDKYLNYTKWKSSTINITEEVNGSFQNFLITPLIFLPLIENAVKYSAHTKAPKITMQWTFADNELVFSISNNFSENKSNLQSTKTGITNLERRLELYHPQSKLTLSQNNTNFTAQLKLWKLTTVA